MSTRGPELDRYDEDDAPAVDTAPSRTQAELSALLETVARERGLDVHRLDDEIVLCSDGEHRVLFHGLTSSSSSKLAHVLCGNDAWLRSHLAHHGIPVVPTRLVGLDDPRLAQHAAESLGYPVCMRLAGAEGDVFATNYTADDASSFHEGWGELAAAAPDRRSHAILEHRPSGQVAEAVVVQDQVVACWADGDVTDLEPVRERALRAVTMLPKLTSAQVSVIVTSSEVVVDVLRIWPAGSADLGGPQSSTVVAALLHSDQAV